MRFPSLSLSFSVPYISPDFACHHSCSFELGHVVVVIAIEITSQQQQCIIKLSTTILATCDNVSQFTNQNLFPSIKIYLCFIKGAHALSMCKANKLNFEFAKSIRLAVVCEI
jgi:hypothetical protein